MSEREKLIDKIAKLKRHAESAAKIGSEAEAQAFATMMQRLMSENKILMSEVEHQKLDETDPIVEAWYDGFVPQGPDKSYGGDHPRRPVEWMHSLAGVVARAQYCRIVMQSYSNRIGFCGRKSDCESALFAFTYLAKVAVNLADAAYFAAYREHVEKGGPWFKGYRSSWLAGFTSRLKERYDEEMAAMKAKWASSGNALVRLTDAMTKVDQYMTKFGFGKARKRKPVSNPLAYAEGRAAANTIRLRGESSEVPASAKKAGYIA